jgi:hypothetical protein
LAFAVLDLTGSATDLGLVLLASRLPQCSWSWPGAWSAIGCRDGGDVGLRPSALRHPSNDRRAAVTGTVPLWQLLALQAAHGAAAAFFDPATTRPGSPDRQPGPAAGGQRPDGPVAQGQRGSWARSAPGSWSPPSARALALAVDAASFAVSAWSLALLRPLGTVRLGQGSSFFAQLVAGWATIATAYVTGAVVGGRVGLRWRPRRPLLAAVLVVVALAPLIAGLAVAAPLPVLAVAGLLGGLQASLHEVLWNTSRQQHVPAEALSRVSAYGWLGALVFAPLGYALAGPVADWLGVPMTLWIGPPGCWPAPAWSSPSQASASCNGPICRAEEVLLDLRPSEYESVHRRLRGDGQCRRCSSGR